MIKSLSYFTSCSLRWSENSWDKRTCVTLHYVQQNTKWQKLARTWFWSLSDRTTQRRSKCCIVLLVECFFMFCLTILFWNFKWYNLPQDGKYFAFKLTILEKEEHNQRAKKNWKRIRVGKPSQYWILSHYLSLFVTDSKANLFLYRKTSEMIKFHEIRWSKA